MDVLSHGLWGGIAFGRASRKTFLTAFAFGVLPDVLSFGPHLVGSLWDSLAGAGARPIGPRHGYAHIPGYIFATYDFTHSLVVFLTAFLLVWALRRRAYWPMGAWGLHILVDIPTHSNGFFPTPFLWPLSDYKIDGIPWGEPIIFIPNLVLLASAYLWYFLVHRRRRRPPGE